MPIDRPSQCRWLALLATVGCAAIAVPIGAQSSSMFLLDLPGDSVSVRYTPGSLDRAVQLQDKFEPMVEDFRSFTKSKVGLVILLLAREDWSESGFDRPYGLPQPAGGRGLALPAWGDEGTVELWQSHLASRLPTLDDQPLRGTPEQAASLAVSDLLGSVEAARILLRAGGISGDPPWVERVLAHALAYHTVAQHRPGRIADVRLVMTDLSEAGGGPGAYRLSASQQPPSTSAGLWFDSQFFTAAEMLVGPQGKFPIKALFKQARKNGSRITAADLLARCPELDGWRRSRFSAE